MPAFGALPCLAESGEHRPLYRRLDAYAKRHTPTYQVRHLYHQATLHKAPKCVQGVSVKVGVAKPLGGVHPGCQTRGLHAGRHTASLYSGFPVMIKSGCARAAGG